MPNEYPLTINVLFSQSEFELYGFATRVFTYENTTSDIVID
jgi:hypothetical protein